MSVLVNVLPVVLGALIMGAILLGASGKPTPVPVRAKRPPRR
jgi:hypothetical protein